MFIGQIVAAYISRQEKNVTRDQTEWVNTRDRLVDAVVKLGFPKEL